MASKEVQAMALYLSNSGVPHRVTATTGTFVSAANPCSPHAATSYHCRDGTDGVGLAIDVGEPAASHDTPGLLAIFAAFVSVESKLAELFYSGAPYGIKDGKRITISQDIRDTHHDHVHVAVPRGVMLVPQIQPTGVVIMPDDPNLFNITGPVTFHPVYNQAGECTGYYIFSTKTGELHSYGPGAKYFGRSEVIG